jgi:cell division protein FtsL
MLRILHLVAVLCLIGAAVVVYKVKYESTYEAQRTVKLRAEIKAERDKINALRAEWTRLASPARVQDLATRHLNMKPLSVARIDNLNELPQKMIGGNSADPIGEIIENLDEKPANDPLGNFLRDLSGGKR